MREIVSAHIAQALAARITWFTRVQDIQLYLSSWLMNTHFYNNVFIEYHVPGIVVPPYLLSDADNCYIDIVLEKDGAFYPVNIIYKTTEQALQRFVFGQAIQSQLKTNTAHNVACYDFWKTIRKTEFLEASFPLVKRGLVLFLSNDPVYQQPPGNPNAGYAQFSIHQGRNVPAGSLLNWNVFSNVSNNRPGFGLNYHYVINWVVLPFDPQQAYLLA